MKILFVLPAETIYDQQNRVMAWKHTPVPKKKLQGLKQLAPRLKELGAERVICSDLDNQSGWAVARSLGLRCEEWPVMRRFNFGKHHGNPKSEAEKLLATLQEKWKEKPDIPIQSGDSWSSFKKRIEATKERLKKQEGIAVVLMTPFEIQSLTGVKANLERGRIYEWAF